MQLINDHANKKITKEICVICSAYDAISLTLALYTIFFMVHQTHATSKKERGRKRKSAVTKAGKEGVELAKQQVENVLGHHGIDFWWARWDSNPRLSASEADTLSN